MSRRLIFWGKRPETAEGLIAELDSRLSEESSLQPVSAQTPPNAEFAHLRGCMWVTRQGVHVDRIASAWLIRRFIDPAASFKFVPGKRYRPDGDEIRFDMFGAEFTHEGDRCTGLADPALMAIADGA